MLAVKPVADSTAAEELCRLCSVPYDSKAFTYFAADVDDRAERINHIIGVCTFTMKHGVNRIEYLRYAPGIDDEEAMIIMARTVMNFLYRCEADSVCANVQGVSPTLARKLGFLKDGESLSISLADFYAAPCKYNG